MSATVVASGRRVRATARVSGNREVADRTWWLELRCPAIADAAVPGQFVMVGHGLDVPGSFLLPRPFSVGWRSDDGRIGLLVRVFGSGTQRLAGLREGDELLLLGPLGRPFALDPSRPHVCLAGGVGLAPFIFLCADAHAAGGPIVRLVYGERTADSVFEPALIERLTGVVPEIWTEDGTLGAAGRVTDGLDVAEDPILLACGPTPMLNAVAALAADSSASLQVSVEEYMGCGVGTCVGCVVKSADGRWLKSCIEGPVFDRESLAWPL